MNIHLEVKKIFNLALSMCISVYVCEYVCVSVCVHMLMNASWGQKSVPSSLDLKLQADTGVRNQTSALARAPGALNYHAIFPALHLDPC